MTDLDKMARELLASECPECGGDGRFEFGDGDWRNCGRCADVHTVPRSQAESAIRAALLSAPPGYALVPVELPAEMEVTFCEQWFSKRRAIDDPRMQDCWAAMIAAAPEPEA